MAHLPFDTAHPRPQPFSGAEGALVGAGHRAEEVPLVCMRSLAAGKYLLGKQLLVSMADDHQGFPMPTNGRRCPPDCTVIGEELPKVVERLPGKVAGS